MTAFPHHPFRTRSLQEASEGEDLSFTVTDDSASSYHACESSVLVAEQHLFRADTRCVDHHESHVVGISQKMSWFMYTVNNFSFVAILAAFCAVTFLWFGSAQNPTWRKIATHDWIVQATTVSSAIIRLATGIQAAFACSMLASIALEHGQVLLRNLATIAGMRINSSPVALCLPVLRNFISNGNRNKHRNLAVPILIVLLLILDIALQFTSTILVSDMRTGLVLGYPKVEEVRTGLLFADEMTLVGSGWESNIPTFPAFAEFHEEKSRVVQDGISDTGPTLRAFLPFTDSRERSTIQHYNGTATVVDVRTMCLRPNIHNISLDRDSNDFARIKGYMSIPQELVAQHMNGVLAKTSWRLRSGGAKQVALDCAISSANPGMDMANMSYYHADDQRINFCKFNSNSSMLMPEFFDMDAIVSETDVSPYRNYLVINVTEARGQPTAMIADRVAPLRTSTHNEWFKAFFSRNAMLEAQIDGEIEISCTWCFTAFAGIESVINAHALSNRTEPFPSRKNGIYRYDDVRRQLGQFGGSPEERGVLRLRDEDWVRKRPESLRLPYIKVADNLQPRSNGELPSIYFQRNRGSQETAMLVQEVMKSGGSASFALQSVLTLLAATAYYQQAPLFENETSVEQTSFVTAQIPGGNSQYRVAAAGFLPGYTIVMCILVLHCILVAVITRMFYNGTQISSLHNAWQTLAQLNTFPTEGYLAQAALANDEQVEKWINEDGHGNQLVGIRAADSGCETEIFGLRHRIIGPDI